MTIFTDLKCTLSKNRSDRLAELVITGHSLGAGLAMMLQADICQVNTKECAKNFKNFFDEAPEFKDFLRSSICYGFAGPMVFAKVGEVPAALTTHLTSTVWNFIFRNDLVPRAYAALDIEAVLKSLGQHLSQKYRVMSKLADFVLWGASLKSASEALEALKKTLDLRQFEKHAGKYVHCCQVVVIGKRSAPWNCVRVTPSALSHHQMATYRVSLEWPTTETFEAHVVQWAKESDEAAKPGMSDSSVWSSAQTFDWADLLSTLSNKHPDTFVLPDGEDKHFVHLAVLQGQTQGMLNLIELLRRGANPLRRTGLNGDGLSIVEVVRLEDGDPFKVWLAGLVSVAEQLSKAGCEGSDIAAWIVKQWDENKQLPHVDGDTFCKLKRQNLALQGACQEQIEDGEDENESYSDALARIEERHGKGTLERQKLEVDADEKVNSFLDSSKWGDYPQMRRMLKEDPTLALKRRISSQWSALMQVVYNAVCCGKIDMQDVVSLLECYPNVEEIRLAQKDVREALDKAKQVKQKGEDCSKHRASAFATSAPAEQVSKLLGKISALADKYTEENRAFNIKTLLDDLKESSEWLFEWLSNDSADDSEDDAEDDSEDDSD